MYSTVYEGTHDSMWSLGAVGSESALPHAELPPNRCTRSNSEASTLQCQLSCRLPFREAWARSRGNKRHCSSDVIGARAACQPLDPRRGRELPESKVCFLRASSPFVQGSALSRDSKRARLSETPASPVPTCPTHPPLLNSHTPRSSVRLLLASTSALLQVVRKFKADSMAPSEDGH